MVQHLQTPERKKSFKPTGGGTNAALDDENEYNNEQSTSSPLVRKFLYRRDRSSGGGGVELERLVDPDTSMALPASHPMLTPEERARIYNGGLVLAREMLEYLETPKELHQWASAVSILDDRLRLHEGEATARTEIISPDDARSAIMRRLEEMERANKNNVIIEGQARERLHLVSASGAVEAEAEARREQREEEEQHADNGDSDSGTAPTAPRPSLA
jgi:hypothetical protein